MAGVLDSVVHSPAGASPLRPSRALASTGRGYLAPALDLGGRRWTMSRLLRVGDKVINLDNIEYITRDESMCGTRPLRP